MRRVHLLCQKVVVVYLSIYLSIYLSFFYLCLCLTYSYPGTNTLYPLYPGTNTPPLVPELISRTGPLGAYHAPHTFPHVRPRFTLPPPMPVFRPPTTPEFFYLQAQSNFPPRLGASYGTAFPGITPVYPPDLTPTQGDRRPPVELPPTCLEYKQWCDKEKSLTYVLCI